MLPPAPSLPHRHAFEKCFGRASKMGGLADNSENLGVGGFHSRSLTSKDPIFGEQVVHVVADGIAEVVTGAADGIQAAM